MIIKTTFTSQNKTRKNENFNRKFNKSHWIYCHCNSHNLFHNVRNVCKLITMQNDIFVFETTSFITIFLGGNQISLSLN